MENRKCSKPPTSIYIYVLPPSQNPCFALFSEGCLKQPWECACKSSKQKADVFFESCMQEHWGCACKSSKQKADACCSFTFTLSLEVYDEQNWVCARIRTSQETMNLVTTKDNWMSLSMCENPHAPGNYEPGDDRRQHETSLDILLHMAGNIVSRVHIWARPQWMSLREATDSGIDWYLLVLDQASLQRSAGKKVELFSPCEAEGSIWTLPTFGCQTWERAWNRIWLERMIMQRLSPVAVVVAEMWSFWTAVFGHSLHLVMRYGRGHWIAFGWKGCRGWVLLLFLFLFLLLGCEVYETLSIYCWKAS